MARTYKRDKNGRFAGGGGGGGGGKPAARGISRGTNRLTRDNSGKITGVGGSGATARGGRLATAKGNKRATQTAKIASGRAGGTVGKPKGLKPGAIKPKSPAIKLQDKPSRKAVGTISEAKASRIVARMDANRSGLRRATGTARQTANSIRTRQKAVDFALAAGARARKKGQSLSVNESLQRAVKNASKTRYAKPASKKAAGRISPEKVSRVTGRVNAVTANASSKQGIKRLNATEVGVRAKAFLTRKAGGMSGMVGKTYAQQQAVVAAGLKNPTRYSTQKPNRNKPRAYNELGQANIRRKNQAAANIERNSSATSGRAGNAGGLDTARSIRANSQRLASNAAANAPTAKALKTRDMGPKAPDTARSRNNRLQTANRRVKYFQQETDSLNYKKAVSARAQALAARPAGTGSKVVFRSKNKAANRQNIRANDLTRRVRYDLQSARRGAFSATGGGGRSGIRRTDTGNRQLSLLGGASKKLYSVKRATVQRASGKRR
jgi:hypothetical protein